ncbi:hypothetical protein K440DRAFT_642247 [Wilcoxina mikolae CBS 423.85]|nr:hypothetical protein K440DRAFT_642247 [Wilcoxina mikolae CBS 423.85]
METDNAVGAVEVTTVGVSMSAIGTTESVRAGEIEGAIDTVGVAAVMSVDIGDAEAIRVVKAMRAVMDAEVREAEGVVEAEVVRAGGVEKARGVKAMGAMGAVGLMVTVRVVRIVDGTVEVMGNMRVVRFSEVIEAIGDEDDIGAEEGRAGEVWEP